MAEYPGYDSLRSLNDDERDVMVWGGVSTEPNNLWLVAGLSLAANFQSNPISYSLFYEWLGHIIIDGSISMNVIDEFFRLVRLTHDPRQQGLHLRSHHGVISPDDPDLMNTGHYACVVVSERTGHIRGADPSNLFAVISSRKKSRPGSAQSEKTPTTQRKLVIRDTVRLRDLRCRISGMSIVPDRQRGPNLNGHQVAHIFPLGWLKPDNTSAVDYFFPAGSRDPVKLQLRRELMRDPDRSFNAMLLRADLHLYFDNYQFGIWKEKVYRFESNGALSLLPAWKTLLSLTPVTQQLLAADVARANDVHRRILDSHFITALLWHVAGAGQIPEEYLQVRPITTVSDNYIV